MGKLLLIVLLVVIAVFWLRHKALAQRRGGSASGRGAAPGADAGAAGAPPQGAAGAAGAAEAAGATAVLKSEKMVACARCGLNVPQPEAVPGASGRLYCGSEHRVLARDELP